MDRLNMKKPGKEKKSPKEDSKKVKQPKKQKMSKEPKPPKEKKEGKKGGSTTVLLVILVIALLVAGGTMGFTYLTSRGSSPQTPSATAAAVPPATETNAPAPRPGARPAAKPATPPMAVSSNPDSTGQPGGAAEPAPRDDKPAVRDSVAPKPIRPSTPPPKPEAKPVEVKKIAPAATPSPSPAPKAPQPRKITRHPAARGPIVVSAPPPGPERKSKKSPDSKQPSRMTSSYPSAQASPKTAKPAAAPTDRKTTTVAAAAPAPKKTPSSAYDPKTDKIVISPKSKSSSKAVRDFYEVSPDVFPRKTSKDDLYEWPGGQSYGTSKTLLKSGEPQAWHTSNQADKDPQFKLSETLYMVLVMESENIQDLRRIADALDLDSPKPEIKKTVSFGRDVYWLTVGHYTTESKAYNKAQEIREKGYPTTIVSEKVSY